MVGNWCQSGSGMEPVVQSALDRSKRRAGPADGDASGAVVEERRVALDNSQPSIGVEE